MAPKQEIPLQYVAKASGLILVTGILAFLAGCKSDSYVTQRPNGVKVEEAVKDYVNRLQKDSDQVDSHRIEIQAMDIELPLTATQTELQDVHEYSFYVMADGDENDVKNSLDNGDLRIEVLGIDPVQIDPIQYQSPPGLAKKTTVARITVRSDHITRGFSILASFPKLAKEWGEQRSSRIQRIKEKMPREQSAKSTNTLQKLKIQELKEELRSLRLQPNPFFDRKEIKVYMGDLRTQVLMESQDNVARLFGKEFAKNFYVGRVYLRNRRSDMRLVVYTTSLRASTLFFREPNPAIQNAAETLRNGVSPELPPPILTNIVMEAEGAEGDVSAQDLIKNVDPNYRDSARSAAEQALFSFRQLSTNMLMNPRSWITNEAFLNDPDKVTGVKTNLETIIGDSSSFREVKRKIKADPGLQDAGTASVVVAATDRITERLRMLDSNVPISPLDSRASILVSPNNRALAISPSSERQAYLDGHGYIWRDYYRPMTFQSVLNSLIEVTDNSRRAKFYKAMETAGVVAGGLLGFGPVINEFGSRAYVESVAFTSSIFLPTVRGILLDDLQKYIKNLGDMGMDTVLIVPPNGVVDKYVFFPRGPLFFGIDEYDVKNPSYIVEVSKNDVAVQAMLIERSQELDAGIVSAERLVAEAIDTGKSIRDAENQKLVDMDKQARALRSVLLANQVEKLIAMTNSYGTNAAQQLLRKQEAVYGSELGGLPSQLRQKYNLKEGLSPTLHPISNLRTRENSPIFQSIVASPAGEPIEKLKISLTSTNSDLFPSKGLSTIFTNSVWNLSIQPASNKFGSATLRAIAESTNGNSATQDFEVVVVPEYRPPDITMPTAFDVKSNSKNIIPISIQSHPGFPATNLLVTPEAGYFADIPRITANQIQFQSLRISLPITNQLTVKVLDSHTNITKEIALNWKTNVPPRVNTSTNVLLVPPQGATTVYLPVHDDETPNAELKFIQIPDQTFAEMHNENITLSVVTNTSDGFLFRINTRTNAPSSATNTTTLPAIQAPPIDLSGKISDGETNVTFTIKVQIVR